MNHGESRLRIVRSLVSLYVSLANIDCRDDLYVGQWRLAVSGCHERLERDDLRQVIRVQDAGAVYDLIKELQISTLSRITSQELAMVPLAIAHIQELSNVFEASLDQMVSSSTLWGTLCLVIKVRCFLNSIPQHLN